MPKRGGGKRKGGGGKRNGGGGSRELVVSDGDMQVYAVVEKALGNKRFSLKCYDGKSRIGTVRRMRERVAKDDTVLVSLREGMTDDSKCDIVVKYSIEEARRLKKQGELPEAAALGGHAATEAEDEDMPFDFGDI